MAAGGCAVKRHTLAGELVRAALDCCCCCWQACPWAEPRDILPLLLLPLLLRLLLLCTAEW
jgi:hypothetical protein